MRGQIRGSSKYRPNEARAGIRNVISAPPFEVVGTVEDLSLVRSPENADRVVRLDESAASPIRPPGRPGRVAFLYRAVGLCLAGSDVLCLAAALFVAQMPSLPFDPTVGQRLLIIGAACALWAGVFFAFDLYSPQRISAPETFRRVISATSIGILLLVVVSLGSRVAPDRITVGATWGLALVLELATRRAWSAWLYRRRRDGTLSHRTLVIGTGEEAARMAQVFDDRTLGFEVVGHVKVDSPDEVAGIAIAGDIDALPRLMEDFGADCLFVAATETNLSELSLARQVAREHNAEVRVSANLPGTLTSRLTLLPVGDVTAISLRPVNLSGPQAAAKRVFDVLVASGILLAALPLMGVLAAAIKLGSKGPAFFKQERITCGGRTFVCYKFRTMVVNADEVFERLSYDVSSAFFKPKEGNQVTRVGRILRRLSLDELPQLWNVVRGDMSLVGPRPLPIEQVSANLGLLQYRHAVRAGLTGWWQISGRSDLSADEAVHMDLFYIENWSLLLDLYIVLKTVGVLLSRKGAY